MKITKVLWRGGELAISNWGSVFALPFINPPPLPIEKGTRDMQRNSWNHSPHVFPNHLFAEKERTLFWRFQSWRRKIWKCWLPFDQLAHHTRLQEPLIIHPPGSLCCYFLRKLTRELPSSAINHQMVSTSL